MGPKKKFGPKKKNGPKRPTNLAETTQLQNWAETTQAETTRPKRLRTETTQGPKRFRAETSRDQHGLAFSKEGQRNSQGIQMT